MIMGSKNQTVPPMLQKRGTEVLSPLPCSLCPCWCRHIPSGHPSRGAGDRWSLSAPSATQALFHTSPCCCHHWHRRSNTWHCAKSHRKSFQLYSQPFLMFSLADCRYIHSPFSSWFVFFVLSSFSFLFNKNKQRAKSCNPSGRFSALAGAAGAPPGPGGCRWPGLSGRFSGTAIPGSSRCPGGRARAEPLQLRSDRTARHGAPGSLPPPPPLPPLPRPGLRPAERQSPAKTGGFQER